jgi:hypothetical protein
MVGKIEAGYETSKSMTNESLHERQVIEPNLLRIGNQLRSTKII